VKHFSILSALWAFSLSTAAETSLRPSDFAFGISIEFAVEAPFQEIAVPQAVYESATRADLGDLRVFNGRDEVVAHALRRAEPRQATGEWSKLALFPVRAIAGRAPDELSLRVERNKAGSVVRVRTTEGAAANAPVAFYVVETEDKVKPIRTLEVDWKDTTGEGFAGRLAVDVSDDLQGWRTITGGTAVLRLRHAGQSLDRRRLELPAVRAKFLRLRWVEPAGAPMLSELRAEYLNDTVPPDREWLTLPATQGEKPGEYFYTLIGQMPVDRVRIRLPQANAVASAELHSRARRGDSWQRRAGGLIYRVNKGGADVVQDDFAVVSMGPAREWRLTLSQKDGGLGGETPLVEVGWQPHTLVFAARGAGPYRLAYGKAGLAPGDASIERLLAERRDGGPRFVAQPARLGAREVLGGEQRLSLSLAERSWRTWVLWAVLGVGVVLLGWMAARLAQQMKS
jgi:hypothetical protein